MTDSESDRSARPSPIRDRDARTGKSAAAARIANQQSWVEQQLRVAMERGDFDDLPGAGKPIEGLGDHHDPNWWVKKMVEREHIAVLPASLQLRKDDAELDDHLDTLTVGSEVRREVEEFNERVIAARYSLQAGPPLITMPRDVEATVTAWRARAAERTERARAAQRAALDAEAAVPRRRWWQRRGRG